MPIINAEEIETLDFGADILAETLHETSLREMEIRDPCEHEETHAGIFYTDTGRCVECDHNEKHDTPMLIAAKTFMQPHLHPERFTEFSGKVDPMYHGGPEVGFLRSCDRCGNNLRYLEGGRCVFCTGVHLARLEGLQGMARFAAAVSHVPLTMFYDRFLRDLAEHEGETTYQGAHCKVCKGRERYTNRGICSACAREKSLQAKKKAATGNPTATSDFDDLFG